jgi:hypothetical protein
VLWRCPILTDHPGQILIFQIIDGNISKMDFSYVFGADASATIALLDQDQHLKLRNGPGKEPEVHERVERDCWGQVL